MPQVLSDMIRLVFNGHPSMEQKWRFPVKDGKLKCDLSVKLFLDFFVLFLSNWNMFLIIEFCQDLPPLTYILLFCFKNKNSLLQFKTSWKKVYLLPSFPTFKFNQSNLLQPTGSLVWHEFPENPIGNSCSQLLFRQEEFRSELREIIMLSHKKITLLFSSLLYFQ